MNRENAGRDESRRQMWRRVLNGAVFACARA